MEPGTIRRESPTILKSVLLLAGAFTFAFLLGELVHDSGHYFAHLAYGNTWIKVFFDPFGGTHIMGADGLSDSVLGVTSLAGPLSNWVLGVLSFVFLWRYRRPILIPLLLWGPVSMIQEGVTFSLGFLTPGGDAFWISQLGIPKSVILIFGIMSLAAGILILSMILALAGIRDNDPFWRKLVIVFLGMDSLMIMRFVYSYVASPAYVMENLIPLIFSFILTLVVVILHPHVSRWLKITVLKKPISIPWTVPLLSLALGVGMLILQIII